jgi:hypothetical protein
MSFAFLWIAISCSANTAKEGPDSDGDGLSDTEEEELGLDPNNEDSDGDRLPDGEEVKIGSDPKNVDTDGDTYWDGDEVLEGHSPIDPEDRIYTGYWPYNAFKDELGDPGPETVREMGQAFPRFRLVDQHMEEVDLYDWTGRSAWVVVIDNDDTFDIHSYWMKLGSGEEDDALDRAFAANSDLGLVALVAGKPGFTAEERRENTEALAAEQGLSVARLYEQADHSIQDYICADNPAPDCGPWPKVGVVNEAGIMTLWGEYYEVCASIPGCEEE